MNRDSLYPLVIAVLLLAGLLLVRAGSDPVVVPAQSGPVCPAPEPTGTQ